MHDDSADTPLPNDADGLPADRETPWEGHGAPDDQILIGQVVDGDEPALRRLIERYDGLVRYTIFRTHRDYCQRDAGWLDARANETWIGVVKSLRGSSHRNPPANLPTYLIQIAKNKCLDAARKAGARQVFAFDEAQAAPDARDQQAPDDENPLAIVENLEQIDNLRGCMAGLSEDDQLLCSEIALIMDRRWREAAERLGLAESTLRSRWGGVIIKLKRCLEKKIKKNLAPGGESTDS